VRGQQGFCGNCFAGKDDERLSAHGFFDQALWQFGSSAASAHGSFDQAWWQLAQQFALTGLSTNASWQFYWRGSFSGIPWNHPR